MGARGSNNAYNCGDRKAVVTSMLENLVKLVSIICKSSFLAPSVAFSTKIKDRQRTIESKELYTTTYFQHVVPNHHTGLPAEQVCYTHRHSKVAANEIDSVKTDADTLIEGM